MKLNNKGFAITVVLYGLLILFVALVSSYLLVLSARKNRVDNLIKDIESEYNEMAVNENEPNPTPEPDPTPDPSVLTVTLNKQDGTGGTDTIYFKNNRWYSDSNASNRIASIQIPQKAGNTFGGYYELANGSGNQIIDENGNIVADTSIDTDKVYYAKWTVDNKDITIKLIYSRGDLRPVTIDTYSGTTQYGGTFTHTFNIESGSEYINKNTYPVSSLKCNGNTIYNGITDRNVKLNREITVTLNSITENMDCTITLVYADAGTM